LFLYYSYILGEANETIEENAELMGITDELFDGLNNINEMLTPIDRYYINEKRLKYLEEGFLNELQDTIREDEEREFQYAVSLFHLGYPERSLAYLYYSQNWKDHLMIVKSLMLAGEYTLAELALEEYIEGGRYHNFGWLKTDDLIWYAEKLGRFDLAEKLYQIIESNNTNLMDNPAYEINRGHIYLAMGEKDSALVCYKEALALNPQTRVNFAQDLHTFSYFDVIDDDELREIANRMKVEFIPAFTNTDTLTTSLYREKLYGDWVWEGYTDNHIKAILSMENDRTFARYHIYTDNGSYNDVSHVRFEKTAEGIIWDEYNPLTDNNSYGILEEFNEDYFVLRIIENGNPEDKGAIRRFERLK
jgi:tetratricopeptide (TPR) repeat protein